MREVVANEHVLFVFRSVKKHNGVYCDLLFWEMAGLCFAIWGHRVIAEGGELIIQVKLVDDWSSLRSPRLALASSESDLGAKDRGVVSENSPPSQLW